MASWESLGMMKGSPKRKSRAMEKQRAIRKAPEDSEKREHLEGAQQEQE